MTPVGSQTQDRWLRCLFNTSRQMLAARSSHHLSVWQVPVTVILAVPPPPPPPSFSSINPAILAMCFLGAPALLVFWLVPGSWILVPSPTPSSHGLVQSAGHVLSGPFWMTLTVLSLISILKTFSSTIPWSGHVLIFSFTHEKHRPKSFHC